MTRTIIVGALVLLGAACQAPDQPVDGPSVDGTWIAYSRTATAITGDISLSPTLLRMVDAEVPLRAAATIPRFDVDGDPVAARVLALVKPDNPELLKGNTFGCGKPVRWIAVWRWRENGLTMAVFDDVRMPTSYDGPGFCGSYYYEPPPVEHRQASAEQSAAE